MEKLLYDPSRAQGIFDTLQVRRAGVSDLDPAFLIGGDIDALHVKVIARCVIDIDIGKAIGDTQNAGQGKIAYENGGWIYVLDLASEETSKVTIAIHSDNALTRPTFKAVDDWITGADVARGLDIGNSRSGSRAS